MIRPPLQDDRGAVLVMVAIFMSALVLFLSFVIDVGDFFTHKRHLQLQADAAAFAAEQNLPTALTTGTCPDSTPVIDTAKQYGGIAATPGNQLFNRQIGTGGPVEQAINSATYPGPKPNPADSTVNVNGLCASPFMIDVKMSDDAVPWFFRIANAAVIHAHARISLFRQDTFAHALPVAVQDPKAKAVRVTFIDEDSTATPKTELGHLDLHAEPPVNGLSMWDNAGAPFDFTVSKPNIGMRVAISGDASDVTCGHNLVVCYDASNLDASGSPLNGLLFIRGWTAAGTGAQLDQPNPPLARDVTLLAGSCLNAYFTTTACAVGISAQIDWGNQVNTSHKLTAGSELKLTADMAGQTNVPLTFHSNGRWESSDTAFTIPANAGPKPVTLHWEETVGKATANGALQTCKTGNGNKCTDTFPATVQRAYSASDVGSGPIKVADIATVGDRGTLTGFGNSVERCSAVQTSCTSPKLQVTIGIQGSLDQAQSVDDPPRLLKVVGQNQAAIDCDPNKPNLRDELATGCDPTYQLNTGQPCPTNFQSSPQPWHCVLTQTGQQTGQVPQGLADRILGSDTNCTDPAHWNKWRTTFPHDVSQSDPRIVGVFVTPFGTFSGSGNAAFPLVGFSYFYITGWSGSGNNGDPCAKNNSIPSDQKEEVPPDPGEITGHFFHRLTPDEELFGDATQPCDLTSFGACVARLTE
jgi:Putative Flp pilus-assembly TadE/G-like